MVAVSRQMKTTDREIGRLVYEPSPFGTRYVVEGIMTAPDGRSPLIRTVWFIRNEEVLSTHKKGPSAKPGQRTDLTFAGERKCFSGKPQQKC